MKKTAKKARKAREFTRAQSSEGRWIASDVLMAVAVVQPVLCCRCGEVLPRKLGGQGRRCVRSAEHRSRSTETGDTALHARENAPQTGAGRGTLLTPISGPRTWRSLVSTGLEN